MEPTLTIVNQCVKAKFSSEKYALEYIKRRENKGSLKPRYTYQCVLCLGWHITTHPPKKTVAEKMVEPLKAELNSKNSKIAKLEERIHWLETNHAGAMGNKDRKIAQLNTYLDEANRKIGELKLKLKECGN